MLRNKLKNFKGQKIRLKELLTKRLVNRKNIKTWKAKPKCKK